MLLSVENIKASYGQVKALLGVSLYIDEGEIISVIGANGAGKSTMMKSIMGNVRIKEGTVTYKGQQINQLQTHKIVENGLVYVPEGREVFTKLSVQDNLEMGAYCRKYSPSEINSLYEECYEMFPILKKRRRQLAGSLSGGEQQMLALCRALMSSPTLMMLDEPSLGLAPIIVDEVFEIIKRINKEKGISIILVEQNAFMAMEISSRCYVLENGLIIASGDSKVLMNDPKVKAAYLGS